jgi:chromosome segregation ATPase
VGTEKAGAQPALFRIVEALTVELRELSAALDQAEKERRSESLARLAAESVLQSERERLSGIEAELARVRAAAARHEAMPLRVAFDELEARGRTRGRLIETLTGIRNRLEQGLGPVLADLRRTEEAVAVTEAELLELSKALDAERARADQLEKSLEGRTQGDDDARALGEQLSEARSRIADLEAQAQQAAVLAAERGKLAQRIGELERTLAGRDHEVRALADQLNEARGRMAELRVAELESRLRQGAELDAERQRSREAAAELRSGLEAEREKLGGRIGELERALATRDDEARRLEEQLSEARGQVARQAASIETEQNRLRTELDVMQRRSEEAAAEFRSNFDAERGKLAERIGELERTIARRDDEARTLGQQLSEARGRVAELETRARHAASLETERDRLLAELEALRERLQMELEEVRQRSEEAAAELRGTLEAERERLARRIDELEGTIVGRDNQARVLEEQLDGARSRVAELEAQAQQIAEMKAERHRLRTELDTIRRRSEEAAADRSVLEAERGKLAERIDELNALLATRNNETRALEGQLLEARGEVAELEGQAREAAQLEAERDRMRTELGIVRQRSGEATTELRSAIQAERLMLTKRIDQLSVALLGRDDQARSLAEQLDEARSRVAELEAQAQQIAQIEAERDRLYGELESRRQGSEKAAAEFRATLDAERTKLAKRIQLLEGRLHERESDARALGERLSEARARVRELEAAAEASSMRSFSTWIRTLTSRG